MPIFWLVLYYKNIMKTIICLVIQKLNIMKQERKWVLIHRNAMINYNILDLKMLLF